MFPVAYNDCYAHPLPEGHRFPMIKYELLPQQLLLEGIISQKDVFQPGFPDHENVLLAHTETYVKSLLDLSVDPRSFRKTGFPLSKPLIDRELRIAQGTIDGARMAFDTKIAFNIAGGTHHAYSDHGEAFCLLNDQAIAAHTLLREKRAEKILIVDLDVHQGNGTAEIFANDQRVFTFSMHGKSNYPFKKEHSDLDVALPDNAGDSEYLAILTKTLPHVIREQQPDFVFYLSGVDILASDKLGKLGCTLEGCFQRDLFVFSQCREHHLPVQCSMGGGYSPDIRTIIEAHTNTYRAAQEVLF